MADESTPIGVAVQLRGDAVTPATAEIIVKKGSLSVTLTPVIASGEVASTITAANLTTLGATMLDVVTAWFECTVVDGYDTHRLRYEMLIVVTDREARFALVYEELERQLPAMKLAAAIPRDQTNFWPQVRIALRGRRNWLNRQQANVKDYLLTNTDELRELAECDCLALIADVMSSQDNGQTRALADRSARFEAQATKLVASINATVKAGNKAWQESDDGRVKMGIRPITTYAGNNGYGGAL